MAAQADKVSYIQRLVESAPAGHYIPRVIAGQTTGATRVFCSLLTYSPDLSAESIFHAVDANAARGQQARYATCVVENITLDWIATLGSHWDIEPGFFIEHFENPAVGADGLWADTMYVPRRQHSPAVHHKIEGIVNPLKMDSVTFPPYRRREQEPTYGWMANCRTSYLRVSSHLYLFLVDRALALEDEIPAETEEGYFPNEDATPTHRLILRVPYSLNRGGLSIPQLYKDNQFSMFNCLRACFSHGWILVSLFARPNLTDAIDPTLFSHILSASLWQSNLTYLDRNVKRVAFDDLRRPSVLLNDRLHDFRRDLNTLKDEVKMAMDFIDPEARQLSPSWYEIMRLIESPIESPEKRLFNVASAAKSLDAFLMDTFQLLMSTITVLDSQANIADARRGARLTQLATIYVPLSFVTGIFGMNLKEINGSPLSVWVTVVALVIVALATGLLLWAMTVFPDPFVPSDEQKGENMAAKSPVRRAREPEKIASNIEGGQRV